MSQCTDQQLLTIDLDIGNRLDQDPVLQLLLLSQLEQSVQLELKHQNARLKGDEMKEVRDLASGMREALNNIKKASTDAKSELDNEVARSQVNVDKVRSMTRDLKDANLEVESMLGDSGSNFPSTSATPQPHGHTDRNGVTVNSEENK